MKVKYNFLRFPGGKTKALTLSYDDGCKQDIRFSKIVTKYGLKCTFNLNSNSFDGSNPKKLSAERINSQHQYLPACILFRQ